MRFEKLRRKLALVWVVAIGVAGCGGGGGAPASGSPASAETIASADAGPSRQVLSNAGKDLKVNELQSGGGSEPTIVASIALASPAGGRGSPPYVLRTVDVLGGGQIQVPSEPLVDVTFDPPVLRLKMLEAQTVSQIYYPLTAKIIKNVPAVGPYAYVYSDAGIFQNDIPRVVLFWLERGIYGYPFGPEHGFIPINPKLPRGVHSGMLRFRLCKETTCADEYPIAQGYAWPYEITVLPPIELGLEVDGAVITDPVGRNATDPVVRPIEVRYGAVVTIRSSKDVLWNVGYSGMTATNISTTLRTWTGTLAFSNGSTPPPEGRVTVSATTLLDGDPYSVQGARHMDFHIFNR